MNNRLICLSVAAVAGRECAAFAPPGAAHPRRCQRVELPPVPMQLRPELQVSSAFAAPSARRGRGLSGGLRSTAADEQEKEEPSETAAPADSVAAAKQKKDDRDRDYIRPYLKQLFLLARPVNFPVVALFHVLGVHQAVQLWASASASASSAKLLGRLLVHPSMLLVLLSLLLVTSTSMITNDYYDAKNGVDVVSEGEGSANEHYHPLARGEVPFSVAKAFDSYLYAILLLSSPFVPGVLPRLLVIGGAIVTYLYTTHLKPKTWIKNLSCAALVAMSPVTSGLAAWSVLTEGSFLQGLGASVAAGADAASAVPFHMIFRSPLSFLVVSLFAGIMSREILMDITDCEGDAKAGIETVPVRYGRDKASSVALVCSLISAFSATFAALMPWIRFLGKIICLPSWSYLFTNSTVRKVVLSVIGSWMLLYRAFDVWRTKGDVCDLAEKAVSESLISVLFILASFIG